MTRRAPGRMPGWRRLLVLLWLCCLGSLAGAQTLDDIDLREQADARVVRLRFNAAVRFIQQQPTGSADLYQVRFELITTDELIRRQVAEEFRRTPSRPDLPDVTVTYRPEPNSRLQTLTVRLSRPGQLQTRQGGNSRSLEFVLRSPAPPPAPVVERPSAARFAVLLQRVPAAQRDRVPPVPAALQQLEVVTSESVIDGVATFQVSVGFFRTREEAEAARSVALARFPQARVVDLNEPVLAGTAPAGPPPAPVAAPAPPPIVAAPAAPPPAASAPVVVETPAPAVAAAASAAATAAPASAPEPRVAQAAAPAASAPAVEPTPPPPVTAEDTERIAAETMGRVRDAQAARRTEAAIALLNDVLKLPPNAQSMAAQEAIGNAWEQAGNPARARVEYELYLKLYPQGEGATRVAERLRGLGVVAKADTPAPRTDNSKPFAGSIAQYYYGGRAKSKSLVNIASGIDQATLSRTSESAIVTSVDLSGRIADDKSETRAVIRGSGSINLLKTGPSSSSLSAVYVDHRRLPDGLAIRAGRQSPISGGLLGLFDGISLAYPVTPGIKVDLMGGVPANPLVSAPSERLLAAVVEADGLADRWGGNAYLLDQTTEGITNRRALGSEVRYAGDQWSLNTLLDYDTLFRAVNAFSLHASVQAGGQSTLTLLADQRRAPSLQLTNALISSGAASLKTLLQTKSLEEVKADALATSAQARQVLVSLARPLDKQWQMSTDLRYSEVGALPQVGEFAATPATGAQYTATLQLTGTNLYSARDIHNVNFSVTHTPTFNGLQIAYNNLTGMLEEHVLTVEPSIRLYAQRDQEGVQLWRVGPGLRMTYKASLRASLLGEVLYEASRTKGPTNSDNTQSAFFYVGYRYELF